MIPTLSSKAANAVRRGTRCLEVWSGHVVERLDGGFPVTYEPPIEADTPHGDFPRSELEDDEELEDDDDDPNGPDLLRVRMTPTAALGFIARTRTLRGADKSPM